MSDLPPKTVPDKSGNFGLHAAVGTCRLANSLGIKLSDELCSLNAL